MINSNKDAQHKVYVVVVLYSGYEHIMQDLVTINMGCIDGISTATTDLAKFIVNPPDYTSSLTGALESYQIDGISTGTFKCPVSYQISSEKTNIV